MPAPIRRKVEQGVINFIKSNGGVLLNKINSVAGLDTLWTAMDIGSYAAGDLEEIEEAIRKCVLSNKGL